jgi:hypothetical protein
MARCEGRLSARVLFDRPPGLAESWVHSDLWREAESIPGVVPMVDDGAGLAHRFGARTSGQAVLYGPDGRLEFRGGITGARGHSGGNAGRTAVIACVTGGSPALARAPVFGCALDSAVARVGTVACRRL